MATVAVDREGVALCRFACCFAVSEQKNEGWEDVEKMGHVDDKDED